MIYMLLLKLKIVLNFRINYTYTNLQVLCCSPFKCPIFLLHLYTVNKISNGFERIRFLVFFQKEILPTLAGWAVEGKAGAAKIPGEGSTVVASTGVGSAVVAVTDTGGVAYGKLVIGVLSGATERRWINYINNIELQWNCLFPYSNTSCNLAFKMFFLCTSTMKGEWSLLTPHSYSI